MEISKKITSEFNYDADVIEEENDVERQKKEKALFDRIVLAQNKYFDNYAYKTITEGYQNVESINILDAFSKSNESVADFLDATSFYRSVHFDKNNYINEKDLVDGDNSVSETAIKMANNNNDIIVDKMFMKKAYDNSAIDMSGIATPNNIMDVLYTITKMPYDDRTKTTAFKPKLFNKIKVRLSNVIHRSKSFKTFSQGKGTIFIGTELSPADKFEAYLNQICKLSTPVDYRKYAKFMKDNGVYARLSREQMNGVHLRDISTFRRFQTQINQICADLTASEILKFMPELTGDARIEMSKRHAERAYQLMSALPIKDEPGLMQFIADNVKTATTRFANRGKISGVDIIRAYSQIGINGSYSNNSVENVLFADHSSETKNAPYKYVLPEDLEFVRKMHAQSNAEFMSGLGTMYNDIYNTYSNNSNYMPTKPKISEAEKENATATPTPNGKDADAQKDTTNGTGAGTEKDSTAGKEKEAEKEPATKTDENNSSETSTNDGKDAKAETQENASAEETDKEISAQNNNSQNNENQTNGADKEIGEINTDTENKNIEESAESIGLEEQDAKITHDIAERVKQRKIEEQDVKITHDIAERVKQRKIEEQDDKITHDIAERVKGKMTEDRDDKITHDIAERVKQIRIEERDAKLLKQISERAKEVYNAKHEEEKIINKALKPLTPGNSKLFDPTVISILEKMPKGKNRIEKILEQETQISEKAHAKVEEVGRIKASENKETEKVIAKMDIDKDKEIIVPVIKSEQVVVPVENTEAIAKKEFAFGQSTPFAEKNEKQIERAIYNSFKKMALDVMKTQSLAQKKKAVDLQQPRAKERAYIVSDSINASFVVLTNLLNGKHNLKDLSNSEINKWIVKEFVDSGNEFDEVQARHVQEIQKLIMDATNKIVNDWKDFGKYDEEWITCKTLSSFRNYWYKSYGNNNELFEVPQTDLMANDFKNEVRKIDADYCKKYAQTYTDLNKSKEGI